MSSATKRKIVTHEVENDVDVRPDPENRERIAKITAPKGNNLHEVVCPSVEDPSKLEQFLVSMPKKFRKNIWVKRGDFVIVTPIEEGDKVKAEIAKVILKDQVKELIRSHSMPEVFLDSKNSNKSESEEDDDLFVNTNRPPPIEISCSESEEESDEETEDSSEEEEDNQKESDIVKD